MVRTECERCEPRCLADIPLIDHTDLQRQTKPILRRKPILIKKTMLIQYREMPDMFGRGMPTFDMDLHL